MARILKSRQDLRLPDPQSTPLRTESMLTRLEQQREKGALAKAQPSYTVPAQPLREPTYKAPEDTFGVMRDVAPIRDHFLNARAILEDLRTKLTLPGRREKSLLSRVQAFLKAHLDPGTYARLEEDLDPDLPIQPVRPVLDLHARLTTRTLPRLGAKVRVPTATEGPNGELVTQEVPLNAHAALFRTGKVLSEDIQDLEILRKALERCLGELEKQRQAKAEDLESLTAQLLQALGRLEVLNQRRAETADDYAVAQRLLAEHWQDVEQATEKRRRILASHRGLYYTKVRETPLSRPLPDPLDLRFAALDDLVPGVSDQDRVLPRALAPFMESLHHVPAAHWESLRPLVHCLPGRERLDAYVAERRERIALRLRQPMLKGDAQMEALLVESNAHLMETASLPCDADTLLARQLQAFRILSLGDLMTSLTPTLQGPSQTLHRRLQAAVGGMLDLLDPLAPSLRLAWAEAAEGNRLAVEDPARWPGLDRAEAQTFNTTRTLVELVGWWFRQLSSEATANTRTALRNVVRACLLLAASDDPRSLLQGKVIAVPPTFNVGEILRLELNQEPEPGATLHLLGEAHQVLATLRVEDHGPQGTLASLVTLLAPQTLPKPGFRVLGRQEV